MNSHTCVWEFGLKSPHSLCFPLSSIVKNHKHKNISSKSQLFFFLSSQVNQLYCSVLINCSSSCILRGTTTTLQQEQEQRDIKNINKTINNGYNIILNIWTFIQANGKSHLEICFLTYHSSVRLPLFKEGGGRKKE